ncbi:MAG: bifunctional DNA-formamidopyrimidine glycosylase/DNA-(apurinic or apyrimidinic site) lyase [Gammaproteobacteria bacterium]
MPELPEVETTRRGIEKHIIDQTVRSVTVRNFQLRWPIPQTLVDELPKRRFSRIERRGKYLLIYAGDACLLIHLGMSGSLRITNANDALLKHDHVDIVLDNGAILRYCDPRRFGCFLWFKQAPEQHPLLKHLGPEPLTEDFNAQLLYARSRNRRMPVKTFIMDSHIVVGVGNIYANEALFVAGIKPDRSAGKVSKPKYERLVSAVKEILQRAITQGGTTLKDFVGGDGKPGYFKQSLLVYGRAGQQCSQCQSILKELRIAGRSSVYCPQCQK